MAYPHATIYSLDAKGMSRIEYEQTEHYQITSSFLVDPARYFKHLFSDEDSEPNK